jgi:NAD(P)-dependent dehydrogenase (short-subunit alcohol dehydrogenase family)
MESAPSRIVNVNAGLYVFGRLDLEHTPYGHDFSMFRTYCNSKLAGVIATREMARRLEGAGVTVNALHPGVIRTGLGETPGLLGRFLNLAKAILKTPEKGADPVIHLATSSEVANKTGCFFMLKRDIPVIRKARDDAFNGELWKMSERLTG